MINRVNSNGTNENIQHLLNDLLNKEIKEFLNTTTTNNNGSNLFQQTEFQNYKSEPKLLPQKNNNNNETLFQRIELPKSELKLLPLKNNESDSRFQQIEMQKKDLSQKNDLQEHQTITYKTLRKLSAIEIDINKQQRKRGRPKRELTLNDDETSTKFATKISNSNENFTLINEVNDEAELSIEPLLLDNDIEVQTTETIGFQSNLSEDTTNKNSNNNDINSEHILQISGLALLKQLYPTAEAVSESENSNSLKQIKISHDYNSSFDKNINSNYIDDCENIVMNNINNNNINENLGFKSTTINENDRINSSDIQAFETPKLYSDIVLASCSAKKKSSPSPNKVSDYRIKRHKHSKKN